MSAALVAEFRELVRLKDASLMAGDASRDSALYAQMAKIVRALDSEPKGQDDLRALLRDDDPAVASWIASELAARKDPEALAILKRISQGADITAFNARMALEQARVGKLRSPFGLDVA